MVRRTRGADAIDDRGRTSPGSLGAENVGVVGNAASTGNWGLGPDARGRERGRASRPGWVGWVAVGSAEPAATSGLGQVARPHRTLDRNRIGSASPAQGL